MKARKKVKTKKKIKKINCAYCLDILAPHDRALFVEEEVGRLFCSEHCISLFFSDDVKKLEEAYERSVSPHDLSSEEKSSLSHLRWMTLENPSEVWRQKVSSGDYYYTLIDEFNVSERRIWNVCICLYLRGYPSFLLLSFMTHQTALVNDYRRGEKIDFQSDSIENDLKNVKNFRKNDIPYHEFYLYESCFSETLDAPDEVWSQALNQKSSQRLFHFIKHYHTSYDYWYVVVAREMEDNEEQIEILEAFPTRSSSLVARYRQGYQEIESSKKSSALLRVVH